MPPKKKLRLRKERLKDLRSEQLRNVGGALGSSSVAAGETDTHADTEKNSYCRVSD